MGRRRRRRRRGDGRGRRRGGRGRVRFRRFKFRRFEFRGGTGGAQEQRDVASREGAVRAEPDVESRVRVETDGGGGGGGGGGLGAYRSFSVRVRVRIRVVVVQDQVWSVRGDAQTSRGRTAVSVSQVRGETSRTRGVARIRGGDRPFEFQICRKRRFESSAASASRTLWELREREAAIEAELAAIASSRRAAANRRAATEELERHMAFSRSLEVVVEELSRRVARR